jgi:hypothetical protein
MPALVVALVVVIGLVGLPACGAGDDDGAPDAGPPVRALTATVTVDATGFSDELALVVPEGTRSVTVVATGAADALYALGSWRTPDGVEHVGVELAVAPGAAMRASYDDEQIGQMPGALAQSIRLGTFTHVYPYRPGQALPAGDASLRIASDRPGAVEVTVLMPPDDGAATLHLNVFAVSETLTVDEPPSFLAGVQAIFAQVGITVVVDDVIHISNTELARITASTEPQETPGSMAAMLPGLVGDRGSPGALDVFVVERLPFGIGGLSLGTPGPPVRGSYYYGVLFLVRAADADTAHVLAHEVSHFLALQHVVNRGVSGATYPDPLDDTEPGQGNLMEDGDVLTPDQGFALTRSALLTVE